MKLKIILFIYKWLPITFHCHCKDHRSFIIKNRKFPICARCTGELVGIILALVLYIFLDMPNIITCFLMMIPLIVDGFLQQLSAYESTNTKRLITGFLFGVALYALFAHSTIYCFQLGVSLAS